ncbi:MAG: hypothetical protein ACM3JD_12340, partial [Rudaea sp.]
MDEPSQPGVQSSFEVPGPQVPAQPPLVTQEYRGNQYDVYSLIAGTLGGATLAMCVSGNLLLYCLPVAPLVLGIIALRRAPTSVDPQRTRNLAWIGIAGGGLGTLLTLCMLMFLVAYFA